MLNIEIVTRQAELAERCGWRQALEEGFRDDLFDEDVEWIEDPSWPGAGTCRGRAAVSSLLAERTDTFDVDTRTEQIIDAGDEVVSLVRWRGRGRSSGAEADLRVAIVTTLRAGKITRVRFYLDPDEALRAVGVAQ